MRREVVHIEGYCSLLRRRGDRTVHIEHAVEPDATIKWRWVNAICTTCKRNAGTSGFNRAVGEHQKQTDEKRAYWSSRGVAEKHLP